jgi:hypothetical protein
MVTWIACAALLLGTLVYVFYPQRVAFVPQQKTRLDFLRERKAAVYDNLRDLSFEYRAGKYTSEDFAAQQSSLENEAAQIVAEIEFLERGVSPR